MDQEKIKARIEEYVKMVQDLQQKYSFGQNKIEVTYGKKYARVLSCITNGQKSVHSFIDLSNGNVLKPASWGTPSLKNPRANIFADDCGRSGVTEYGVVYLR